MCYLTQYEYQNILFLTLSLLVIIPTYYEYSHISYHIPHWLISQFEYPCTCSTFPIGCLSQYEYSSKCSTIPIGWYPNMNIHLPVPQSPLVAYPNMNISIYFFHTLHWLISQYEYSSICYTLHLSCLSQCEYSSTSGVRGIFFRGGKVTFPSLKYAFPVKIVHFGRPQTNFRSKSISHRAVIDTFFRVDISEVNYATCWYIIDNIQTHFPY